MRTNIKQKKKKEKKRRKKGTKRTRTCPSSCSANNVLMIAFRPDGAAATNSLGPGDLFSIGFLFSSSPFFFAQPQEKKTFHKSLFCGLFNKHSPFLLIESEMVSVSARWKLENVKKKKNDQTDLFSKTPRPLHRGSRFPGAAEDEGKKR
jgi:hypothetical protein